MSIHFEYAIHVNLDRHYFLNIETIIEPIYERIAFELADSTGDGK